MKLIIPSPVYKKLRAYVLAVTTEISFLGKVEKVNNNLVVLHDIYLLPQVVGSAHTVLDKEAMGRFYDDLMEKGEDPSSWKTWIHSHADMQAFYSGTDENTIESFDLERPDDNWFLSIVVNRAGAFIPRIDLFSPIRVTITDIEWDIVFNQDDILPAVIQDIALKVTKEHVTDWKKRLEERKKLPEYLFPPKA